MTRGPHASNVIVEAPLGKVYLRLSGEPASPTQPHTRPVIYALSKYPMFIRVSTYPLPRLRRTPHRNQRCRRGLAKMSRAFTKGRMASTRSHRRTQQISRFRIINVYRSLFVFQLFVSWRALRTAPNPPISFISQIGTSCRTYLKALYLYIVIINLSYDLKLNTKSFTDCNGRRTESSHLNIY